MAVPYACDSAIALGAPALYSLQIGQRGARGNLPENLQGQLIRQGTETVSTRGALRLRALPDRTKCRYMAIFPNFPQTRRI